MPLRRTQRRGARRCTLTATFQGCQTDGICYPPMTRTVQWICRRAAACSARRGEATPEPPPAPRLQAEARPRPLPVAAADCSRRHPRHRTATAPKQAEDSRLAAALAGRTAGWALLSFFGFGLLLAFTPCVLPMIPILSGLIAGHGPSLGARPRVRAVVRLRAGQRAGVHRRRRGRRPGRRQPAGRVPERRGCSSPFALLFVALALSSFGLYELQLPAALRARLGVAERPPARRLVAGRGGDGRAVGADRRPLRRAAAGRGRALHRPDASDPVFGGAALFLLAMGMGVPLLAFGVAAGRGPADAAGRGWSRCSACSASCSWAWRCGCSSRIAAGAGDAGAVGRAAARRAPPCSRWRSPSPVARRRRARLGWTFGAAAGVLGAAQLVGALAGSARSAAAAGRLARRAAPKRASCRSARSSRWPTSTAKSPPRKPPASRCCSTSMPTGACPARRWRSTPSPNPRCSARSPASCCSRPTSPPNDDVDQALMKRFGHHRPAGDAVLRRRRASAASCGCSASRRPTSSSQRAQRGARAADAMRTATRRSCWWRVVAGVLGAVAGLWSNGPGPLLRTELGQRALQAAHRRSRAEPPAGWRSPDAARSFRRFALPGLDGTPRRRCPPPTPAGRVLINFWASWCGPCIEEMPELDRFARDQGANGTQVVGIALDDAGAVQAFLQRIRSRYPILLDTARPARCRRATGQSARACCPTRCWSRRRRPRCSSRRSGRSSAGEIERLAVATH